MSEMNSDDMDDLFKKAGQQYPLRTDSADWDSVSGKLGESSPSIYAIPKDSKKSSGKRKYLMLIALFALVLGGYYSIYKSGHGSAAGNQKQISSQKQIKENNSYPAVSGNFDQKKSSAAAEPKISSAAPGRIVSSAPAESKGSSAEAKLNKSSSANEPDNLNKAGAFANDFNTIAIHAQLDKPQINDIDEITLPAVVDISKRKPADQSYVRSEKLLSPAASKKRSKFYAGILIAPDISTVKFQSIKGVGFSAGLLAGYRINKKFSIETGAQLDIKDYYSEGEYFDKKNIPNLDYSDLINITGNCKMIEVPLNIRYNFHQSLKNDWFITTGFSTYFMFRESYDYNYMHYGMQKAGYYATTKPSQYWFSVFNISIGYEHQIGKIGSLRVEPYLKSPLTGMGTGSLPIMSAGINLGIIHKF